MQDGSLIFWFHSYDARFEDRASVHVGKGLQDDYNDAKVWLEPRIELAKAGRTLRQHEVRRALQVIDNNRAYLLEAWYDYRRKAS